MGYYDDMKGMETRLHRAARKLIEGWAYGKGGGAPPVGSIVYEGLRDLEMALTATDWVSVKVGLPDKDEDACIGDEYVRSVNVLVAVAGTGEVHMAYFWRSGSADGGDLHYGWKHVGRDGYDVEGVVTKWQPIPTA